MMGNVEMKSLPLITALLATVFATATAKAADIRVSCYSDGNECEVTQILTQRFMQANPDIHVTIDTVPYKSIQESLPVQLAAGNGPDIARVTDFASVSRYFLDLRPLLPDVAYWEANFGPVLEWMRTSPTDKGIYGMPTQLTVTAPIVNKTLFDQAGVKLPDAKATWDDWAVAVDKVAHATQTPFGMAMDRSGHRFAGGAISYGAKYFTPTGTPAPIDDGFKAFASRFVTWNKNGTMEKDVWAAAGGSGYRDAFQDFANGQVVAYISGSWQIARLQKSIGDGFEWVIAPNPCGPAACTGMPGGASFVAFKGTKSPKEVAKYLDYLAGEKVYSEMMSKTANIPAHAGLQKTGVKYDLPAPSAAALKVFTAQAESLAPLAYKLQGYPYSRTIFNASVARLSQVIVGELSLDQAYARISEDVKSAVAASQ
jgi:alpha-1,4-digalacturonate transport system substrate-binding protein